MGDGANDSGGYVKFAGAGLLEIDGTSMPTAVISGFGSGDVIDLAAVPFDSHGSATLLSGNVLQVTENGGTYKLQLDQNTDYSGTKFYLVQEAGSGKFLDFFIEAHPATAEAIPPRPFDRTLDRDTGTRRIRLIRPARTVKCR